MTSKEFDLLRIAIILVLLFLCLLFLLVKRRWPRERLLVILGVLAAGEVVTIALSFLR